MTTFDKFTILNNKYAFGLKNENEILEKIENILDYIYLKIDTKYQYLLEKYDENESDKNSKEYFIYPFMCNSLFLIENNILYINYGVSVNTEPYFKESYHLKLNQDDCKKLNLNFEYIDFNINNKKLIKEYDKYLTKYFKREEMMKN